MSSRAGPGSSPSPGPGPGPCLGAGAGPGRSPGLGPGRSPRTALTVRSAALTRATRFGTLAAVGDEECTHK
eukprot:1570483-Prymnesium_polylepis.1